MTTSAEKFLLPVDLTPIERLPKDRMKPPPKTKLKNKNVKLERRNRELSELKQLKDKVDSFVTFLSCALRLTAGRE